MIRIVLIVLLFLTIVSAKELQRIALFIGNNNGLANEIELKYAAKDAEEMAQLLVQSKTFDHDRVYLLKNKDIPDIKSAFVEVNGRVKELKKNGQESMVLLFYSGHGSENALHINGKKFHKDDLSEYFESLSADLKIMFVDACESGNLLRQKGGRLIKNHHVEKDELKSKGSIVITSSARGEFAQESEEYKGAVFTHHLLNALRGAADFNLDKQVSLFEAFEYARNSTQNEMILGKTENQNPGFDMNIVGESDIVLANVTTEQSNLFFKNFPGVMLTIHNASNSKLYSRLYLSGKERVLYSIPRGRYILSYEEGDAVRAKMIDMAWSNEQELSPNDFKKQHKSLLYAKGSQRLSLNSHGLQAGISFASPIHTTSIPFYSIGYIHRSYNWKQLVALGFGAQAEDEVVNQKELNTQLYLLKYSASRPVYQHPYGQVLVGLGSGYISIFQDVKDNRLTMESTLSRHSNVFLFSGILEMELYMPMGIWVSTTISPEVSLFKSGEDGKMSNYYYISPSIFIGYQF